MKKTLWTGFFLLAALFLVGCSKPQEFAPENDEQGIHYRVSHTKSDAISGLTYQFYDESNAIAYTKLFIDDAPPIEYEGAVCYIPESYEDKLLHFTIEAYDTAGNLLAFKNAANCFILNKSKIEDIPAATQRLYILPVIIDEEMNVVCTHNELIELFLLSCSGKLRENNLPPIQNDPRSYRLNLKNIGNLPKLQRLSIVRRSNLSHINEIAKLKNIEYLDLSGSKIQSLKRNTFDSLPRMEYLNLSDTEGLKTLDQLSAASLEMLLLDHCQDLERIGSMEYPETIKTADFSNCENLSDISGLSSMKGLEWLSLNSCDIVSLAPLSGLEYLKHLNIERLNVVDLTGLNGLSALETVDVSYSKGLTSFNGMKNLPNLKECNARQCEQLADISAIAAAPNLERLSLNTYCKIVNLDGLSALRNLNYLDLYSCEKLSDLSQLEGLDRLETLYVDGSNSLADIDVIGTLKGLKTLILTRCDSVDDIRALGALRNLEELQLYYLDHVTDFSVLSQMDLSKLKTLTLAQSVSQADFEGICANLPALESLKLYSSSKITSIACVRNIPSLSELILLECTGIRDYNSLQNARRINRLVIHYDDFTNVEFLSGLSGLVELSLAHNENLNDISALANLSGLKRLDLSYDSAITDISILSQLPNLNYLDVNSCENINSKDLNKLNIETIIR